MITCWKLAPATAAGNTLIIKTPEYAPLYGQKLAQLVLEAGFPPGVINIVCGEGRIAGQALASHMDVHKIAFTGSTATGRAIMKAAAESNLKKVTLELGGKSASIVFEDADFDNAVFWTTLGITANNGQVCAAGSRIYVHSSIYERFLKAFSARSAEIVQGNPLTRETTKGPMINKTQHDKVISHIDQAIATGVKKLHGGKATGDNVIENTAFFDVAQTDAIMQEEVFGPVAVSALHEDRVTMALIISTGYHKVRHRG
jgi:aldehyde dehydrogenase (NAD+)